MIKSLPLVLSLFLSTTALAQTGPYLHEYKSGKHIFMYSYIQKNDSSFIHGLLKERRTDIPIQNINIAVKDFPIGTVPDTVGNFKLFLPRKEGTITFDKRGVNNLYFEFPYKYVKDDLKKTTAHH